MGCKLIIYAKHKAIYIRHDPKIYNSKFTLLKSNQLNTFS
jgi:hypothetical protein